VRNRCQALALKRNLYRYTTERDDAIAAAKVHEKEHAGHMVCSDTERHLQENYILHYSCRFDAANTAPNPLVAYSVRATMSDGKANDGGEVLYKPFYLSSETVLPIK
jgi:hypothetical protein